MSGDSFNFRQWAEDHDRRDEERFAAMTSSTSTQIETLAKSQTSIWRILAFVGVTFVALTSWSLRNQYETMAAGQRHAQEQLNAIYAVSGQVAHVQATVPNPSK